MERRGNNAAHKIESLPAKDSQDPIWEKKPCERFAKLIKRKGLFYYNDGTITKCIRCHDLNACCNPIPDEFLLQYDIVQSHFHPGKLGTAFTARDVFKQLVKTKNTETKQRAEQEASGKESSTKDSNHRIRELEDQLEEVRGEVSKSQDKVHKLEDKFVEMQHVIDELIRVRSS